MNDPAEDTKPVSEKKFGSYSLLERIGSGGMGEVWKARDQLGNLIAIKTLLSRDVTSRDHLQRFKTEAVIMSKLAHHNVCRVYDVGEYEGIHYIAMELVDGVVLSDILAHGASNSSDTRDFESRNSDLGSIVQTIRKEKSTSSGTAKNLEPLPASNTAKTYRILPMPQTLNLIIKIAEAMQYAHEHGILHRDLKPGNIMIRPNGEPVVMDFGLAKLEHTDREISLSLSGQVLGTVEYMAPEQAQSAKAVTERSDVFSLGAILYQMLTGKKHFHATGNMLLDALMLNEHEPVPPQRHNPLIEPDLAAVTLKALRPDPKDRYGSMRLLANDLDAYSAGDPVSAKNPTLFYRASKNFKKYKTPYSLAALLIITALCFVGYWISERYMELSEWNKAFECDFTQPEAKAKLSDFIFCDYMAKPVRPPELSKNGMRVRHGTWCWLKSPTVKGNVRVVIRYRYVNNDADMFSIYINAKNTTERLLDEWFTPISYQFAACLFYCLDGISKNETNGYPKIADSCVTATKKSGINTILAERRDDVLRLNVNHQNEVQKIDLLPLQGYDLDRIGFNTQSDVVEILSLEVYRLALPKKASPIVSGDALLKCGRIDDAIREYEQIAADYPQSTISQSALTRAYAAAMSALPNRTELISRLKQKSNQVNLSGRQQSAMMEMEAIYEWTQGRTDAALQSARQLLLINKDSSILAQLMAINQNELSPDIQTKLARLIETSNNNTVLEFRNANIQSLEPFAKLKLLGLGINNNSITSLAPIKAMPLRYLNASQNQIHDLSPLSGMPLMSLFLRENKISDLSPLKTLPLINLQVAGNLVESLEPLRGMSLGYLRCDGNKIHDLNPLAGMRLHELYCSGNPIGDISILQGMPLRSLDIIQCNIRDISPLHGVPLTTLSADGNHITDITPLTGMPLENLFLSFNQIQSLEPLRGMRLKSLNCRNNALTSLEPFVSEPPPNEFTFDCDTIPDTELERAAAKWEKNPQSAAQARKARLILAIRHKDKAVLQQLALSYARHCYLYVPKYMSYEDALSLASRVGAHLATPQNQREHDFLKAIVPPRDFPWIGLMWKNGHPSWITGEPMSWRFPNPMYAKPTTGPGVWNDYLWNADENLKNPHSLVLEWDHDNFKP